MCAVKLRHPAAKNRKFPQQPRDGGKFISKPSEPETDYRHMLPKTIRIKIPSRELLGTACQLRYHTLPDQNIFTAKGRYEDETHKKGKKI